MANVEFANVKPGVGMLRVEPGRAGGLAEDHRRAEYAQAGDTEQGRPQILDQGPQFTLKAVDLHCQLPTTDQQVASDPGNRAIDSGEPSGQLVDDAVPTQAVGGHLQFRVQFMQVRPVGLRQHRELLVSAGWLALVVGCVEYDLGVRADAEATRIAARQLGTEAGHAGIVGWSWELAAWFALTQSRHSDAIVAARAGQEAAGSESVAVQLIAQEAKALGRFGDVGNVRATLDRGWAELGAMPHPDQPDNHFVVDPAKWDFYAMDAYRVSGDDDLAAHHAQEVLRAGVASDGSERSPMRMAEARLTLAATAARAGELEEAVATGLSAFTWHRRSLPSLLLVAGEVNAELQRRHPEEAAILDFSEALWSLR